MDLPLLFEIRKIKEEQLEKEAKRIEKQMGQVQKEKVITNVKK